MAEMKARQLLFQQITKHVQRHGVFYFLKPPVPYFTKLPANKEKQQ